MVSIAPISIKLVLSFAGKEGPFAYLNKEWKNMYVEQYGMHDISLSVLRTYARYRWIGAEEQTFSEKQIEVLLRSRLFDTSNKFIDMLVERYSYGIFCYTAMYEDIDLLVYALRSGRLTEYERASAIKTAILYGNLNCFKMAMTVTGLSIEAASKFISYPLLSLAAKKGSLSIVEYLLPMYSDPQVESLALGLALGNKQIEVANYLFACGVKCTRDTIKEVLVLDSVYGTQRLLELLPPRSEEILLVAAVSIEAKFISLYLTTHYEISEETNQIVRDIVAKRRQQRSADKKLK